MSVNKDTDNTKEISFLEPRRRRRIKAICYLITLRKQGIEDKQMAKKKAQGNLLRIQSLLESLVPVDLSLTLV